MAQPICKFFMSRFLEPWYQLSKEEQDSLVAKLHDALKKVGGTQPIRCNSSWSSDQWSFAGYEVFPNIEAVQKYMAALQELNWFRYCEATSVLGTKLEPS
jgi:peptidoglycan/xylan/chitin deacetylase (PgdA/CDA1 family)